MFVLSECSRVGLFATPRTVACQASLSMGFFRQEYWSGLPCPALAYFPHPPLLHLLDCFVGLFSPPSPSEAPAQPLDFSGHVCLEGRVEGTPARSKGACPPLPFRRAARRWGSGQDPQGGSCLVTGSLSRPQCLRLPAAHPLPGDWPGRIPTSRLLRPGVSRRRQPGNARPRPGAPQPLGFLFGNRLAASALAPAGSPPRTPAEGARRAGKLGDKSILSAAWRERIRALVSPIPEPNYCPSRQMTFLRWVPVPTLYEQLLRIRSTETKQADPGLQLLRTSLWFGHVSAV